MAMTPSQYLKLARQDFQHLPADVCDEVLAGVENSESGVQCLAVPDCIPANRMLFANASRKYSVAQRHNILQKSL